MRGRLAGLAVLAACLPAAGQDPAPQPQAGPQPQVTQQPQAIQQPQAAQRPQQTQVPEAIDIGLSTDRVRITSDFSGADLTIFGSVDNTDPQVMRQGRYDVIVVLEGPARPVVVRRKERVLGVWMNTRSETFVNVPTSYSVATTRAPQDITAPVSYRQLALRADNIHIEPMHRSTGRETRQEFTAALRDRKKAAGLYNERVGGVEFLSQSLFRATLSLSADVPVGTHRARAFLFKNGVFIKETSAPLAIVKAGFEQTIYEAAHRYSFFYGLFAVGVAIVTGWLGRVFFRRD